MHHLKSSKKHLKYSEWMGYWTFSLTTRANLHSVGCTIWKAPKNIWNNQNGWDIEHLVWPLEQICTASDAPFEKLQKKIEILKNGWDIEHLVWPREQILSVWCTIWKESGDPVLSWKCTLHQFCPPEFEKCQNTLDGFSWDMWISRVLTQLNYVND